MLLVEEKLNVVLMLGESFFRLIGYELFLIELSLFILGVNILVSFGSLKYFVFLWSRLYFGK